MCNTLTLFTLAVLFQGKHMEYLNLFGLLGTSRKMVRMLEVNSCRMKTAVTVTVTAVVSSSDTVSGRIQPQNLTICFLEICDISLLVLPLRVGIQYQTCLEQSRSRVMGRRCVATTKCIIHEHVGFLLHNVERILPNWSDDGADFVFLSPIFPTWK